MKIQYVIYVLVVFLFASCSNGGEDENRGAAYGKVNVALSVTLPEPENVHSLARSYTDSEIKN